MALYQQAVLLVPALMQQLLLLHQVLVALHFAHDLLLILRVQRRKLRVMALLRHSELLLVLHLHLVLLLQQQLKLLLVGVQLSGELVCQLLELLVVVEILQAQLVFVLHRQLVDLRLQLAHALLLLLHVCLGHQHLLSKRELLALLAVHFAGVLVLDVKHKQGPVLAGAKQQAVVVRYAEVADQSVVALELLMLASERKLVAPHRAGLCGCKQGTAACWQNQCSQQHACVQFLHHLTILNLFELLVTTAGKDLLLIGAARHAAIVAALEHILPNALEVEHVPLVHSAIQAG
mmetsp:Transcript_18336/g.46424  ORF Transcript_18336/g.46424 Transcript_18336/m.46424 type:complete len:291 (+) Transcript_18336:1663-2535(+)